MFKKNLILAIILFLTSLTLVNAQSAFDSSRIRLSVMAEGDIATPKNNISTSELPFRISPELGFDISYGRQFRIGLGMHYFDRLAIYQGNGLAPENHRRYLTDVKAFDVPINLGTTLFTYKKATFNLNITFALGGVVSGEFKMSKTSDLRIGFAVDLPLPRKRFLEISVFNSTWFVNAEGIETAGNYGLGLRWGGLFFSNNTKHAKGI